MPDWKPTEYFSIGQWIGLVLIGVVFLGFTFIVINTISIGICLAHIAEKECTDRNQEYSGNNWKEFDCIDESTRTISTYAFTKKEIEGCSIF